MTTRADLPTIEGENIEAWAAAKERRLVIARCHTCGKAHHYPRPMCPFCWSDEVALEDASGRATVYTYSTVHMNDLPPFNKELPYVVATVDLEEGPRLVTRLVDCPEEGLAIGMAVRATFVDLSEEATATYFRPEAG